MLIINLPNMAKSKQTGQESVFSKPRGPHRETGARAHTGADVVEISAEARRRLEEERLVSLEAARMRKTAAEVAQMLRESGGLEATDTRSLYRPWLVNEVREEVDAGAYTFEGHRTLETAAESILIFLAA